MGKKYTHEPDEAEKWLKNKEQLDQTMSGSAIMNWNEEHTCPMWGSKSWVCHECQKGLTYRGTKDVSSRRCPDHPVAADGSMYIFRAKNRKVTNRGVCRQTIEVNAVTGESKVIRA